MTKEARSEIQKNDAQSQIEQTHMEHAMTSQMNLNADTDKARSSSRNCKMEWLTEKKENKSVIDKIAKKGKSTNRWRNINSSIASGERGAQWKRDYTE